MQTFELTITGDGPTTNTRFDYAAPRPNPGIGYHGHWSTSPNSVATWEVLRSDA
jgi:hypothetical protein